MENENQLEDVAQPNEEALPVENNVDALNDGAESAEVQQEGQNIEEGAALEEKPKSGKPAHERIGELTKRYREEERARLQIEQELLAERHRLAQYEAYIASLQEPQVNQNYGYEPQYQEPQIDPNQIVNLAVQEFQKRQVQAAFESKVDAFTASLQDPDAIELIHDPHTPSFAPEIVELLVESPHGSAIVSHLAFNRDEIARLAKLPIHRQSLELAKLENLVSRPPVKATSAPPPAPTVGARGGTPTNYDNDLAAAEAAYLRGEI